MVHGGIIVDTLARIYIIHDSHYECTWVEEGFSHSMLGGMNGLRPCFLVVS
jgi:hypothetical protein